MPLLVVACENLSKGRLGSRMPRQLDRILGPLSLAYGRANAQSESGKLGFGKVSFLRGNHSEFARGGSGAPPLGYKVLRGDSDPVAFSLCLYWVYDHLCVRTDL